MKKAIYNSFSYLLFIIVFSSCGDLSQSSTSNFSSTTEVGTADEKSAALVSKLEEAMGGKATYDDIRYISWTFFGNRKLWWDKHSDRVRIENPKDTSIYLLDIKSMEGRYQQAGKEVTGEELDKYIDQAHSIWINDSYWLVMPWKLRDPGVNLEYLGKDTLNDSLFVDHLQLTFDSVGVTPQNKYVIAIDQSDHLIKSWSFYRHFSDSIPVKTWPWDNYQPIGDILISYDRSDKSGPSEVKVYKDLPDALFSTF